VGHAARMGDTRNAYNILIGKPEGKRPLGKPRRRWKIILLGNRVVECRLNSTGSEQGSVAGPCEHGNEPSGFIKGGNSLSS